MECLLVNLPKPEAGGGGTGIDDCEDEVMSLAESGQAKHKAGGGQQIGVGQQRAHRHQQSHRAGALAPERRRHDNRDRQSHQLAESQDSRLYQRNLGKKMGLEVQSAKNDSGERTYRITA